MLYIFLVDTGAMLPFDMSLTTETVQTLKEHVERATKLPVSHQVMLISGGECLDSTKRVCSYPTGTDTNPIYLFSRAAHMHELPNQQFKDLRDEEELLEEVRNTSILPPSFQIIDHRAHLAEQFKESAIKLLQHSKQLVLDQHYQHQGWAAVIANCEDLLLDFKFRFEQLKVDFREYVVKRERFNGFLERFKESLKLLRKIPLLPKLHEIYKTKKFLTESTDEVSPSTSQEVDAPVLKLFDWIGEDEHGDDVEQKYEKCLVEITKYSVDQFTKISYEVEKILSTAGDQSMKEIKGLGPMLFQLDKFIQDAEKKVREQVDCASSIVLNQNRINNVRDSSILPDLCASHVKQLSSMAETHRSLMNIYIACTKGKMEFNKNLSLRFPWLKHVHNAMQNLSDHMDVFSENISSLKYQLDILEQVDVAAVAYLSYVNEVVRRRSFSQAFMNCTSKLASCLWKIHNEELTRRDDFKNKFDDHFIRILFPGMRDQPPGYGIYQPTQFDNELPELSQQDIEFLKCEVPEMIEYLKETDSSYSSYFSLFKSLLHIEYETGKEDVPHQIIRKDAIVQSELSDYVQKNISKAMRDTSFITVHGLPYLKDLDKGCESETDTEEFEKVGQSPLDLNFEKDLSAIVPHTQDASTSTEVGDRSHIPPRKPPRSFQKLPSIQTSSVEEVTFYRTLSISGSQSNSESFTNIKNPSLESIDELSSLKNVSSNTESCFNSHYQQQMICGSVGIVSQYMSSPISPKYHGVESPKSPVAGHQTTTDFVNDEFYIDESLPSSLSIETGQSQGEFGKQLDTANTVVALLQDNLQISKSEFDKLKSLVMQMGYLASQTITQLKSEVHDLKFRHLADKSALSNYLQKLNSCFENLGSKQKEHDDMFNQMSTCHSNDISDFRKLIQVKNEEIKSCRSNILFLEQRIKTICKELTESEELAVVNEEKRKELEKMFNDSEIEKEKSIKEVTERLNREHRDEIKTLQARFKLMTMERTTSESSLEKTLECSSFTNHESIINQITENFEIERDEIVKEIISKETEKWERVINQLNENFEKQKSELIEQDQDKECQIRDLKNREKLLLDEIKHYTSTIEELSRNEVEDLNLHLMDKIEALETEKSDLSSELQKVTERLEMTTSVVDYPEGKMDSSTSPIRQQKILSKSFTMPSCKMNKLSLDYLKPGDSVVVVWDEEHETFRIVQDSPVMYFLHSECVKSLDLEIYEGFPRRPNKFYCLAEYVLREYCHARKSKNRYRVPKGTRFFQVKVKPFEHKNIPEHCELDTQMTQSNLTSNRTMSESSTTELDFHSLPSSPKLTPDIRGSSFDNSSEVVHGIPSESDNSFFSADNMNFRY